MIRLKIFFWLPGKYRGGDKPRRYFLRRVSRVGAGFIPARQGLNIEHPMWNRAWPSQSIWRRGLAHVFQINIKQEKCNDESGRNRKRNPRRRSRMG